jgi:hypothetical protein
MARRPGSGLAAVRFQCFLPLAPPPTARAVLPTASSLGWPCRSGSSGEEWAVGFRGDASVQGLEDVCVLREFPWSHS